MITMHACQHCHKQWSLRTSLIHTIAKLTNVSIDTIVQLCAMRPLMLVFQFSRSPGITALLDIYLSKHPHCMVKKLSLVSRCSTLASLCTSTKWMAFSIIVATWTYTQSQAFSKSVNATCTFTHLQAFSKSINVHHFSLWPGSTCHYDFC